MEGDGYALESGGGVYFVCFLYIIWSYSRRGNPLPSLKNRTFQVCFLTIFCAMLPNILSTAMLNWADLRLYSAGRATGRPAATVFSSANPLTL